MKAILVPIYFKTADDPEFLAQLGKLHELLANEAEISEPVHLGSKLPECDGVIFPQMLGDAFRELENIRQLPQPIMVVTSEFGTVSMWDWEINSYLTALNDQWTAVVDISNLLQTPDLFQTHPVDHVAPIPDVNEIYRSERQHR